MRVSDVLGGAASTLELCPGHDRFDVPIARWTEVRLGRSPLSAEATLYVGTQAHAVRCDIARDQRRLSDILDRCLPQLAWVEVGTDAGNDNRIILQIREFAAAFTWPDEVQLGVDEKLVDALRARGTAMTTDEACRWLTDQMLLTAPDGATRALICGSPVPNSELRSGFRLLGREYAADVARLPDDRLLVLRVVEARRGNRNADGRMVHLATGRMQFVDATVAGKYQGIARSQLDEVVREAGSYLRLWKEYNEVERGYLLKVARDFGWLRYDRAEKLPAGPWRFHLANQGESGRPLFQEADIELEAAAEPPAELAVENEMLNPDARPDEDRRHAFVGIPLTGRGAQPFLDIQVSDGSFAIPSVHETP